MKKIAVILGSALGVLLLFSAISYAKSLIQAQNPKAAAQEKVLEVAGQVPETAPEPVPAKTPDPTPASPFQVFSATAYSLRGRTASGQPVTRGLIAADPRVLPIGTRVRVEAGPWTGEYLVADTGGAIKGRKIDIWTPSSREAMQFGRRAVKLTVLSLPGLRAKSAKAQSKPPTGTSATTEIATDKEKK
ncbi:MAG TPA: 3D domain-containing protein [Pyrinomonadaceae bacterium]|nr:3D domain-containing protein [Pyrinomonadaceae bacterium]